MAQGSDSSALARLYRDVTRANANSRFMASTENGRASRRLLASAIFGAGKQTFAEMRVNREGYLKSAEKWSEQNTRLAMDMVRKLYQRQQRAKNRAYEQAKTAFAEECAHELGF
jgi:hypothetical protein